MLSDKHNRQVHPNLLKLNGRRGHAARKLILHKVLPFTTNLEHNLLQASPTAGESEGAPFTAGWLLMVRKPAALSATSCSLMLADSACSEPSASSDQGWLANWPLQ